MSAIDRLRGLSQTVAIKAPVRVATTANITLSGLQTIDGVTVVADDRVLVWNQSTASENGIYEADSGTWSRAPDFSGSGDCVKGTLVACNSGTLYASAVFQLTTTDPVIGTSSLAFTVMGAAALGAVSAFMQTVLDDLTAAAARTTLGAVGLTGNETVAGNKTFTGAADFASGSIVVPTATAGDNDTTGASTGFVQTAIASRLAVADAAGSPTATTTVVAYTSISAARTVSLPAANTVIAGRILEIVDESGSASSTNTISVAPNGSDTIDGSNTTQVCINIPRGSAIFICDGSSKWTPLKWSVFYTNTLGADVTLNNTGTYFTGPTCAQGTVGRWAALGQVTVLDTTGASGFQAKLWDGTTVLTSAATNSTGASATDMLPLSGYIASPAGNIRISVKDISNTTGLIKYNSTSNSADSSLTVWRIP